MEEREYSLTEWKYLFEIGKFDAHDIRTQIDAGWDDWFCRDSSLANKTKRMGKIILKLHSNDNVYVFFKNNCPMVGRLYDSFKICDMENGNVLYCVNLNDDREEYNYVIYGKENDFEKPLVASNYTKDIIKYLNTKI